MAKRGALFYPPFRWDVSDPRQLGTLAHRDPAPISRRHMDELITCCARVLAFAGDSDLVFVGRSLESMYDLMRGLLWDTAHHDRLSLLQLSVRFQRLESLGDVKIKRLLRCYLSSQGLGPIDILRRPRPVAFVDMVASGDSFRFLVEGLRDWALEDGLDWPGVRHKLRIVGLTWRQEPKAKTCGWHEEAPWVRVCLDRGAVRHVPALPSLVDFLADEQPKVTPAYGAKNWGAKDRAVAIHKGPTATALATARILFVMGLGSRRRKQFVRALVGQRQMRERWFRSVVHEVNRYS